MSDLVTKLQTAWDRVENHAVAGPMMSHAEFRMLLELGERQLVLRADRGELTVVESPTMDDAWSFAIRFREGSWERFLEAEKDPYAANVLSMAFQGDMTDDPEVTNGVVIEGDYRQVFSKLSVIYHLLQTLKRMERYG